jgi:long-chain fatty acid transport protein
MKRSSLLVSAAVAAVSMVAVEASASGLVVARFGGPHGHPTTDNPTAIYYNPAGLALGSGTRLMLDASLAWRAYSYERDADAISQIFDDGFAPPSTAGGTPAGDGVAANTGTGDMFNVIASPFLGLATDFGVKGLGVGVAAYVPIGGQSKWNKQDPVAGYPGAEDGPQRWWIMEGSIKSVYISAAAAYRFKRVSFGLSTNLVISSINTVRARNGDGSDDLVNRTPRPEGFDEDTPAYGDRIKEGRAIVDVKSTDISIGAGIIYEPIDGMFIGLSYQSQPGFGENTLTGTATKALAQSDSVAGDAEATQSMPDIVRWGWRMRTDNREYRLFGDYTRWSRFEKQCIRTKGRSDCDLADIPRNWNDAFGVRAGYSHYFEGFELFGDAGYDQNAVPDEYLEPALYDAEKFTGTAGGRVVLMDDTLAIAASYTQVVYLDRTIDAWERGADGRLVPAGDFATAANPNSAGTYKQAIGVFNLNAEYTF